MDRCPFCFIDGATPPQYDLQGWALQAHNVNDAHHLFLQRAAQESSCEAHLKEYNDLIDRLDKNAPRIQEAIKKVWG